MEKLPLPTLGSSFEYSPIDHARIKAASLNDLPGDLNASDGYDCKICKNRGYTAVVSDENVRTLVCQCVPIRQSIIRMQQSGLKDKIRDCTFDKFIATDPWQKAIKDAAMKYAAEPEGWFALCGQSGCGKTHLCTAICRKLLYAGRIVRYMLWRDEIVRIKDEAQNGTGVQNILEDYKNCDVLYIDDLFKCGDSKPTAADINYAFEILNFRYNNPHLLTIISTELTVGELLDVDEAIGGRIFERSTPISISRSRDKNYRIRKAVSL